MDICFVPNPENVRASLSDASQEQYDFLLQELRNCDWDDFTGTNADFEHLKNMLKIILKIFFRPQTNDKTTIAPVFQYFFKSFTKYFCSGFITVGTNK